MQSVDAARISGYIPNWISVRSSCIDRWPVPRAHDLVQTFRTPALSGGSRCYGSSSSVLITGSLSPQLISSLLLTFSGEGRKRGVSPVFVLLYHRTTLLFRTSVHIEAYAHSLSAHSVTDCIHPLVLCSVLSTSSQLTHTILPSPLI